ncbi:hypothetical protein ACJJTC_012952 [Scirpophaga incertulas]
MAEFPLDPPQCHMLIVSGDMGCSAEMAEFPLDPPQCHMLIVSGDMGCSAEVLIIGECSECRVITNGRSRRWAARWPSSRWTRRSATCSSCPATWAAAPRCSSSVSAPSVA